MTTETGGCSPAQKKTATESEIRVRTGAVITLTGILVLYFSRYAYVLEAAAAMLSIMGIVELLLAAKCCTWYNDLLLSLIAAAGGFHITRRSFYLCGCLPLWPSRCL